MNNYVNNRLIELQQEKIALEESEQQLTEALQQVRARIMAVSGGIAELNLIQQAEIAKDPSSAQTIPQDQSSPSHQN
jgi:hypothetical protein